MEIEPDGSDASIEFQKQAVILVDDEVEEWFTIDDCDTEAHEIVNLIIFTMFQYLVPLIQAGFQHFRDLFFIFSQQSFQKWSIRWNLLFC